MSAGDHVPPGDLDITSELYRRPSKPIDYRREMRALQDIAAQMVGDPEQVLPKLVERAMDLTGATSAGLSIFEARDGTDGVFRWRDLQGELARFSGGTVPRNDSPCGLCLDRAKPTLIQNPERHYSWIAAAGASFHEILLVPLYITRADPLGTLWIVAERKDQFDGSDAHVLQELASLAGVALAMVRGRKDLHEAVRQQELLAAEMSHRIKNLFSIVDAMIRVSKRSAKSVEEMASILSGRLHAMGTAHALVRPSFAPGSPTASTQTADLDALIRAIFKPYETAEAERFVIAGPEIRLGRQASTSLALIFHEFTTNATKYGALTHDEGHVSVSWERREETLFLQWRESGGPLIDVKPVKQGFGSTLTRNTVMGQLHGNLLLDWDEEGLVASFYLPISELAK